MPPKEKPYGTYYNATVKKTGGTAPVNKRMIFVVAGGIAAVLIIVLTLLGSILTSRGGAEKDISVFAAKISALGDISKNAKKNIHDREINQINISAGLLFETDKNNLNTVLQEVYNQSGISSNDLALQTDATVTTRLDEAKLLNKFDIQYRAIMEEKLTGAIVAGNAAARASGSKKADTAIQAAITNLKAVLQQLQDAEL